MTATLKFWLCVAILAGLSLTAVRVESLRASTDLGHRIGLTDALNEAALAAGASR